jgi:hypothetical protein
MTEEGLEIRAGDTIREAAQARNIMSEHHASCSEQPGDINGIDPRQIVRPPRVQCEKPRKRLQIGQHREDPQR